MSAWVLVPLIIYAVVVAGFIIAMIREAPKQSSQIGPMHFVVALIWPLWLIWYIWLIVSDKIENYRRRRK